jgi:hypothetical protein
MGISIPPETEPCDAVRALPQAPEDADVAPDRRPKGVGLDTEDPEARHHWRRDAALVLLVALIGLVGVGVGGVLNYWLQQRSIDDQHRTDGRRALLLIYDDVRRDEAALEVARVTNLIPAALPLTTRSWDTGRGDASRILSTHDWLTLSTFFADAAFLNACSADRDHPSPAKARHTIREAESELSQASSVLARALLG